jgi:hypothetical protein
MTTLTDAEYHRRVVKDGNVTTLRRFGFNAKLVSKHSIAGVGCNTSLIAKSLTCSAARQGELQVSGQYPDKERVNQ